MKPAIDSTLDNGRYRLEQRLGAGGMASVWLATDQRLSRPVAVKIIADTLAGDGEWILRFHREAHAAAMLSHPAVVRVYDYGVEDERPYLVMEYVPGGTLADRLAAARSAGSMDGSTDGSMDGASSLPLPHPDQVARELLGALSAVHAAGILHRDVKPSNLLLDGSGHIRLTDFGIAQANDGNALTQTGMVIGTVRYIAPEVAAGGPASVQSDLYSAGVVIRELAGDHPAPPLPALIAALTADEPADRPASAAAALDLMRSTPDAITAPITASLMRPTAPTQPAEPSAVAPLPPTGATQPAEPSAVAPLPPTGQPAEPRAVGPLPPAARTQARRNRSRRPNAALLAALAVVGVAVLVVIALASGGGGSGSSSGKVPPPAPPQVSITKQVQALERIVQSATRR